MLGISTRQVAGLVGLQVGLVGVVAVLYRALESYALSDHLPKPPKFDASYSFPEFIDMVVKTIRKQDVDEVQEELALARRERTASAGLLLSAVPLSLFSAVGATCAAVHLCRSKPQLSRYLSYVPRPLLSLAFALTHAAVPSSSSSLVPPLPLQLIDCAAQDPLHAASYLQGAVAALRAAPSASWMAADRGGRTCVHGVADLIAVLVAIEQSACVKRDTVALSSIQRAVPRVVEVVELTFPSFEDVGGDVLLCVARRVPRSGGGGVCGRSAMEVIDGIVGGDAAHSSLVVPCARLVASRLRITG